MKVLLIGDDINVVGGVGRAITNLANALSVTRFEGEKERCQVTIFSLENSNKTIPFILRSNINVSFYPYPTNKYTIKTLTIPLRLYFKLKIFLYKLKFFLFRDIKLSTNEVLRYILSAYVAELNCDIVIDNCWNLYNPFIKNKHTRYIKFLHTSSSFQCIHQPNFFFDELKKFDCLVYPATEISIWRRYHSSIKVIPNFLPTIPQVCTNYSQKVVLSVGRMSSEKGFLRLLDIWKVVMDKIVYCHENPTDLQILQTNLTMTDGESSLQNSTNRAPFSSLRGKAEAIHESNLNKWKLIIVGDGVLKSEIQSKIRALNLSESVILKPFTKDIESQYLGASIYAMASHFEGFPMVLLESTAYGLAPISFDIATGPSDIIENNKSGFLIADNDLESYADKLIALMSDESMRKRFGSESKRIVSENFSKEVVIEKWREMLEKV